LDRCACRTEEHRCGKQQACAPHVSAGRAGIIGQLFISGHRFERSLYSRMEAVPGHQPRTRTRRNFTVDFSLLVAAEQVRSYEPAARQPLDINRLREVLAAAMALSAKEPPA
jgi:hypothetical protein